MIPVEVEYAARTFEPPTYQWATPGELAQHLEPLRTVNGKPIGTRQTAALDLIDAELVRLINEPDGRLIITVAPQQGKSTRVAQDLPVWALTRDNDTRIITASYGQQLANRNGRTIRNIITKHPELRLNIASDHGAAGEWSVQDHHGGVKAVGIGAGVTGHACDLMIIDDPIKSWAEAYSETYRNRVWDWWQTEANSRLSPGASVVLILTRWHHDDLAGRLLASGDGWRVLNIPAECEDPDTDPLGRQAGEFMESAVPRTTQQWEKRKREAGPLAWASLYQGHPTPDTGNILPSGAWSTYDEPLWLDRDDGTRWIPGQDVEVVASWDLAFKGEARSDYVVGQVWARIGPHAYLLDQVRGRWSFTETLDQIKLLTARWPQAAAKFVEDKANGPAVINALSTSVPGLIPIEPEGSKISRVHAVAPFVHSHNVHLPSPELAAWVGDLIQEAAAFPAGANDDQCDALSQAVNRLLLLPILDPGDDMLTGDDLLEDDPHSYLTL